MHVSSSSCSSSSSYRSWWLASSSCGRSPWFCWGATARATLLGESESKPHQCGCFFLEWPLFMDAVKSEGRRKAAPAVAVVDGALRRPLAPSEKNNAAPAPACRRREVVASRVVKAGALPPPAVAGSTAARRCASPCPARSSSSSAVEGTAPPKRAQSADRRRHPTPSSLSPTTARSTTPSRSATPARDAAAAAEVHATSRRATSATRPPDGLWASTRNFSPSFQSQSVAAAAAAMNRDKPLPFPERKRSPLRGRNIGNNQCENARPSETPTRRAVVEQQHRWPAMTTGRSSASVSLSSSSSSSLANVFAAASSTASRAFQSPSRMRQCASTSTCQSGAAQPAFSYMLDARRGNKNASQIDNIHQLRLLYNRYLQWHFVNARSEDTLSFQKNSVESILYSVWKSILKLRDAVTVRTIDVQHLRQELKLHNILKEQLAYLEEWPALEEGNSSALAGAIEVLKASTLRLPVTSGAQADVVAVKNAISSAVDVMQTLNSSICYLLLKVEDKACLFSELSVMASQEKVTLDECREFLATAGKLQIQESSLRMHLMQLSEGVRG